MEKKNFGPFTGWKRTNSELDYLQVVCPVAEQAVAHSGCWLPQNVLLGEKKDMDDLINAFEKIYKNRDELRVKKILEVK